MNLMLVIKDVSGLGLVARLYETAGVGRRSAYFRYTLSDFNEAWNISVKCAL